jgi:hypothetical protein
VLCFVLTMTGAPGCVPQCSFQYGRNGSFTALNYLPFLAKRAAKVDCILPGQKMPVLSESFELRSCCFDQVRFCGRNELTL